jgi:hypothetical protein
MRLIYLLVLVASLVLTGAAVERWGAAELRNDWREVAFLVLIDTGWLFVVTKIFSWFGVSLRDDAADRKNTAALVALCGALLGVAVTYIGGNLGEGPSYSNNFYSVVLATAALFSLWIVLEMAAKVSVSIAEERDLASGIRLCCLLIAMGSMLGRAVAGDWHSTDATLHDFVHDGWPAGVLCVLAIPIEWLVRPSRGHPFPSWSRAGLLPGVVYLVLAAGWLWRVGRWEGMLRS